MAPLIAYALVGVVAGVIGGMLGISGGFITIPCLILIFHILDFPPVYMMQLAIGTSLAAMIFNSLAASWSHNRHGAVVKDVVKQSMLGLIVGTVVGAFFGHLLPARLLQMIFAACALLTAMYLFQRKTIKIEGRAKPISPGRWSAYGLGIGAIASMIGIGGGILAVPVFAKCGMPIKKAVGTASVSSLVVSFFGALGYLAFGLGETYYPHTIGYIYLPAFAVLAVTTFLFAPLGAKLAHVVSNQMLTRIFALALLAVGILMLAR